MPHNARNLWLEIIVTRLARELYKRVGMYFGFSSDDGDDSDTAMFDMAYHQGVSGLLKFEKIALTRLDRGDLKDDVRRIWWTLKLALGHRNDLDDPSNLSMPKPVRSVKAELLRG